MVGISTVALAGVALGGMFRGAGSGSLEPPYSLTFLDYLASEPLTSSEVWPTAAPGQYLPAEVPGGAPGVAWVRSSGTRKFKIALTNPTPYAHGTFISISVVRYSSASGSFTLSVTPAAQPVWFPTNGQCNQVEFTISGLPNFVTLGGLTFDFVCDSDYASLFGNDVGIKVWLTDTAPIGAAPGHQVPVWAEVLDKSCLWCTGLTGPDACRVACTYGVFGSAGLYGSTQPNFYQPVTNTIGLFRLKLFIDTLQFFRFVDCQDVAGYYSICNSALGVPVSLSKVTAISPVGQAGFRTNPLRGTGWNNYQPFLFAFHAQATSNGADAFDACAAQEKDVGGNFWDNPIPGWPRASYWQFYTYFWGGLAANYPFSPGNNFLIPYWDEWTISELVD